MTTQTAAGLSIRVHSRAALESPLFVPKGNHGVISFYTPGDSKPRFPWATRRTLFAFQTCFDDIYGPMEGRRPIDQNQARWVAEALLRYLPRINRLYIHCDAGISRSSGCAAAISEFLFGDPGEFVPGDRFMPNPLVKRLVLEELRALSGR